MCLDNISPNVIISNNNLLNIVDHRLLFTLIGTNYTGCRSVAVVNYENMVSLRKTANSGIDSSNRFSSSSSGMYDLNKLDLYH